MSTPAPDLEQILTLPATHDQPVTDDVVDENGHMNITAYFRLGSWAVWERMQALGMDEDYIGSRGLSFFTVEHHIRYLSELRAGERFSIHVGLVGRTPKALHGVAFVVDRERERLACQLEAMYVHVDMAGRSSAPIPDDVAALLDADVERAAAWLPEVATGLSLRR